MYADNVANLRDQLTEMRSKQAETFEGAVNTQAENFNNKLEGYTEKWDAVSRGGGEEMAGLLGAHGIYSGYKKVKALYNSVQERKSALKKKNAPEEEDDREDSRDGQDGDEPDSGGPEINTTSQMAESNQPTVEDSPPVRAQPQENTDVFRTDNIQGDRPPGEATGENEIANTAENFDDLDAVAGRVATQSGRNLGRTVVSANVGTDAGEGENFLSNLGSRIGSNLAERGASIRQGFSRVKNFFSRSGGDTASQTAGEVGGEVAGEGGAEAGVLAGVATGDAVLGAVPIVGEVALAVGGLVAIGEGIYHLFHHPHAPPAPPPPVPLSAPTAMIAKYSLALPSSDSSVDRSASVGSF